MWIKNDKYAIEYLWFSHLDADATSICQPFSDCRRSLLKRAARTARKCVGDAHEGWVRPAWHMIKLAASLEAGTWGSYDSYGLSSKGQSHFVVSEHLFGPRRVWFQNLGSACGDDRQWIEVPGKSVIQAAWEIGLLFEPLPVIGRWCTGNNYTRMFYVVLGKYMENIWVRTQWTILTIKYNNLHPASVGKNKLNTMNTFWSCKTCCDCLEHEMHTSKSHGLSSCSPWHHHFTSLLSSVHLKKEKKYI